MPVWGVWVDGSFYFSSGRASRKTRNLARNPRCIVCSEQTDQAVIVEGRAVEIKGAGLIARVSRPYDAKYKPWKLDAAMGRIYAVRPRVVLAMYEKGFPNAATRWRF
jgi:hypothetical protein